MKIYKKIYISQPTKTGSTSLLNATRSIGSIKHHDILTDKKVQELKKSKDVLSVVTVRNPYDRVLSMYNFFTMFKERSFDYFLEYIKKHIGHKFFCPQHLYYSYGAFKVNEIIKIETIDKDWKRVVNGKLNIDIPVVHANKDPRAKKTRLTKDEKTFIYELYKEDFKVFNYEK